MSKPAPDRKTRAIKAVALMPGLSSADRRVAAALIDKHNRSTGWCDPSVDGLAALLGIGTTTVKRSIDRLGRAGLVKKVRHGGRGHRNQYEPHWPRLLAIAREWDARLCTKAPSRLPDDMPAAAPDQKWAGNQTRNGPVTRPELVHKPLERNPAKETGSEFAHGADRAAPRDRPSPEGQGRRDRVDRRQCYLIHALPGRKAPASKEVAYERAMSRWQADLRTVCKSAGVRTADHVRIAGSIGDTLAEAATRAELRSAGAGLALILSEAKLPVKKAAP